MPETLRKTHEYSNPDALSPSKLQNATSCVSSPLSPSTVKENDVPQPSETGSGSADGNVNEWIAGGPLGSKAAVLVFRSCVLAERAPASPSPTRTVGNNTGTTILLNKAKSMARRLVAGPHSYNITPNNVMHEVMTTFGTNKYAGNSYVVRHVSQESLKIEDECPVEGEAREPMDAASDPLPESSDPPEPRKRDIQDVLQNLTKMALRKNINIENTTANIPTSQPAIPAPKHKENSKGKKSKSKHPKRTVHNVIVNDYPTRPLSSSSSESDRLLAGAVDTIKVLDSSLMPASILRLTYKLVNTETKLLHRLLQAHGLTEVDHASKDFNLLWSGLHPKPDVLRMLSPYQRINHFPRSYELTRKDKLFKNIEKMQYFRGLKHFDFIPTTFLMPNEYKELCTAHYKTKGPWIVKPAASSRGRGIYIVNAPEQIPKGDNVVVAKYIDKPLLIGGHKCDLRLYVCMTSVDPLLIYLYEEGLVRFATVKYDRNNKNLWNPCMHLCNYSINKYHTDYVKCDDPNAGNIGHKWTLSALLRHLRKQGRNTTALMAAIEDLVVKSILSGTQTMAAATRVFVPHFNNCFELFGYDILVDDSLKPWLLEINLTPSLACESPLDARVKSALLADTLTLVGLPAVSRGTPDPSLSSQNGVAAGTSLKMRIGACRRVHSAETMLVRGAGGGGGGGGGGKPTPQNPLSGVLTGEEGRLVRAVRAQYSRRGGYVRIFPSQNSWQKYSQYLDPVCGVPTCSTSLQPGAPTAVVQHNYNLLVHSHVLPHFQLASHLADTPERLKRYEAVTISSAAPAVSLSSDPPPPPLTSNRRAKELVKRQLREGMKLTLGEGRRAFGLYLTHVLKRISSPCSELAVTHAHLVLRFLKRAAASLRHPYNVKSPAPKMCDKDKCAVISKQLNDFLYMYYRETDLYTDSEDKEGCVSSIHFAQFMYAASEADLEDVLLLVLRQERYVAPFVGDTRAAYCVDMPPAKLALAQQRPRRHALLTHLANLTPLSCRRYKIESPLEERSGVASPTSQESTLLESPDTPSEPSHASPPSPSDPSLLPLPLKDYIQEEKPINSMLRFAPS